MCMRISRILRVETPSSRLMRQKLFPVHGHDGDARVTAGLTQEQLAQRMATTQSAIARLESNPNGAAREQRVEAWLRDSRAGVAAERLLALANRGPYFTDDPGAISRVVLHERNRNSAEQVE